MIQFWRVLLFVFLIAKVQGQLNIDVASECALLINGDNGKVLFTKNASQPLYPASCTKIAFALYAIKYHQDLFEKKFVCSQNAVKSMPEAQKSKNNFGNVPSYVLESDASHMGLKVGEEMRFYDLLEGSMVVSADDASNMIAEAMGEGSIEQCVQDVNDYLTSIGCKNTHFTNPHGLHHPDHVTTAEDLALMCQEAMKEPLFAKMVKMTSYSRPKTNKQQPVVMRQTNKLLLKSSPYYYPSAMGIKTGYHRRAGHCLAAQAEKNGRSLVSIILHGKSKEDRFQDTKKLLEAAFQEVQVQQVLIAAGPQTFKNELDQGATPIMTEMREPLVYTYYPLEESEPRCQLVWQDVKLPLKKGTPVGELILMVDGNVHQKAELFASNDVDLTYLAAMRQRISLPIVLAMGLILLITLAIIKLYLK